MLLQRWFHLSEYLTLGLSCCALVLAEAPFLPDLQICLAPVLALLLVGWWAEGRWSLPNWGANLLGVLIVFSGTLWVLAHRNDEDLVLKQLPLHLALLPYMGPLLLAALLVKVFRTRDPGHFWHVQGLGLLQVGLGCMLEGGAAFGAAMAVYLASALACLALHYRLSASPAASASLSRDRAGAVCPSPLPLGRGSVGHGALAPKRWLLSFTLRWVLLIVVPALLLFLLTPRRDNWTWEPLNNYRLGHNRLRVRGGTEAMNLNQTGRLEMDDEIALEITAVNADGQPKLDLPVGQRWRNSVLEWYESGTWIRRRQMAFDNPPVRQSELPNFGDGQFILTFTVQPRRAGGLVLAEPIRFGPPSARLPVLSLTGDGRERLFAEQSATLLPVTILEDRREYQYRQVVSARANPDRTPARGIFLPRLPDLLTKLPAPLEFRLRDWTTILLRRLSQQPRYPLPKGVSAELAKANADLQVKEEEWEATGRVLADYLSHSGEFTYSLEITRKERGLDPIEDFLVNVRKGHCELYAAALAAVLRSVKIPARIVKGYRGWDSKGGGVYTLRHHHAHAWVEILVPRADAPRWRGFALTGQKPYDWLTLDPTPPETVDSLPSFSLTNFWHQLQQFCVQTWRSLIVDYNGDEQADLWETLTSGQLLPVLGTLAVAVLAFGIIVAVWLLLRRLRLRPRIAAVRRPADPTSLYLRLARLLERYASIRPNIAQTPREYGEMARRVLQDHPALATLAEWPRRVIELFYRVRFGDQPLREEERQTLDGEFERFGEALSLLNRDARRSALSRSSAGRG